MPSLHLLDSVRRSLRLKEWANTPDKRPSWGIVATVREPVELVVAFACHHVAAGADRVTICFDDPDDPAIDIVSQLDRVHAVRCDAAHWRRLGGDRPITHFQRQVLNVQDVAAAAETDWLFHIDADEFLHMPEGVLLDLARIGRRTRWLRVYPAERIWDGPIDEDDLFGGVFRRPLPRRQADVDRLYGTGHAHLYPSGTSGHPSGKPLFRTDQPIAAKIHTIQHPVTGVKLPFRGARHITLLHFDGLSKSHWALKHLRQVTRLLIGETTYRDARRAITIDILNADDPLSRAFEWYDRIYRLDPATLARLRAAGNLLEIDPEIAATAARMLPGVPLEFSVRAIDAQLSDRIEAALADLRVARRTTTFS